MSEPFNPDTFIQKLRNGEFEGRLQSELRKLSDEELQAVLKAMNPNSSPMFGNGAKRARN